MLTLTETLDESLYLWNNRLQILMRFLLLCRKDLVK